MRNEKPIKIQIRRFDPIMCPHKLKNKIVFKLKIDKN